MPRKKLRILVLMHPDFIPPESIEGMKDEQVAPFKTEYDVCSALRDMGHTVQPLGVSSDLSVISEAADAFEPDIAFNLLEEFDGVGVYDAHVVSYLESIRLRYTGCNPRGLMIAHDKALSKMILRYHRIPVPNFAVFAMGRKVHRPKKLEFPLFVKSLTEEGSVGISQASIVHDDEKLAERVDFVHRTLGTDAIAEEYIDGRELYVAIMGNDRLQTLPTWELLFPKLREQAPRIATGKVKWDYKYQKKIGLFSAAAKDLPEGADARLRKLAKRVYRALSLSGYARMDLRLTPEGRLFLIEANPNPQLAYGEDFAESAEAADMTYEGMLQRILNLGLRYRLRGRR
ncbi:MAG: D-alanine--D-alanine ligase family protein [Phycisphaeraceae bacterium]